MLSRLFQFNCRYSSLFGGSLARFDLNHLATTVLAACRANVVRKLHRTALSARLNLRRRNEMVTAAIALTSAANALFGKSTHDQNS